MCVFCFHPLNYHPISSHLVPIFLVLCRHEMALNATLTKVRDKVNEGYQL